MNNILTFLETKVAPFGEKVGNQRHLKAIREGFMMAMPLILVGSLFLILISWPQEDFTNWLNSVGLLSILTTMNLDNYESVNSGDYLLGRLFRYCLQVVGRIWYRWSVGRDHSLIQFCIDGTSFFEYGL